MIYIYIYEKICETEIFILSNFIQFNQIKKFMIKTFIKKKKKRKINKMSFLNHTTKNKKKEQ